MKKLQFFVSLLVFCFYGNVSAGNIVKFEPEKNSQRVQTSRKNNSFQERAPIGEQSRQLNMGRSHGGSFSNHDREFVLLKKGEALWDVARRLGINTNELYMYNPQLNGMDPNALPVGEKIYTRSQGDAMMRNFDQRMNRFEHQQLSRDRRSKSMIIQQTEDAVARVIPKNIVTADDLQGLQMQFGATVGTLESSIVSSVEEQGKKQSSFMLISLISVGVFLLFLCLLYAHIVKAGKKKSDDEHDAMVQSILNSNQAAIKAISDNSRSIDDLFGEIIDSQTRLEEGLKDGLDSISDQVVEKIKAIASPSGGRVSKSLPSVGYDEDRLKSVELVENGLPYRANGDSCRITFKLKAGDNGRYCYYHMYVKKDNDSFALEFSDKFLASNKDADKVYETYKEKKPTEIRKAINNKFKAYLRKAEDVDHSWIIDAIDTKNFVEVPQKAFNN